MIRRFAKNTQGRDFLCGDIHGHVSKLKQALEGVSFDGSVDRLFLLGDLVDRGPESDDVLGLLDSPGVYALRGNHDQWAIDYHEDKADLNLYAMNGGLWFIGKTTLEQLPLVDRFEELPLAIELETEHGKIGMVHANVANGSWDDLAHCLDNWEHLSEQDQKGLKDGLMWDRSRVECWDLSEVEGVLAVVVGHTPVKQITSLGNTIYIDTGAWLARNSDKPFVLLEASRIRAGGVIADEERK